MPERALPLCRVLLLSEDEVWRDQWVERLSAAEARSRTTTSVYALSFDAVGSFAVLAAELARDGDLQIVILDLVGLETPADLLRQCRAQRAEVDVFVAVGADGSGAVEALDVALLDREETRADTLLRRLHRAIDRRVSTPFADTLKDYVEGARDAWHTPGHSSGDGLRDSPWVADFYDLMGEHLFNADLSVSVQELDSLLEPSHVIQRAQDLAADAFGAQQTFFVTGGTSMANKVVIQHVVGQGGKVLVDQGCHKSIHHAMVLFGADPVYLPAAVNREFGLYGPVSQANLCSALRAHPNARLLVLTSCTYDGFYYDLEPLIARAREAGVKVLVDEAWYAHGRFHPALRPCALESGADYVTQSTHKTLSALSQASMIHVADPEFDESRFREDLNMHTSTSPQYGLIASLDVARKQMSLEGFRRLARCMEHARALREGIDRTESFRVLTLPEMLPDELRDDGVRLDPTKLTIAIAPGRGPARLIQRTLYERFSIQVEKVTHNTLSILVTLGTTQGKVLRMIKALQALDEDLRRDQRVSRPPLLPPLGRLRLRPREAYFGPTELVPLRDENHGRNRALQGRVSAEQVVPYPPGIPVLVPGQEILEETLTYLLDLLQDDTGTELHGLVRDATGAYLRVCSQGLYRAASRADGA